MKTLGTPFSKITLEIIKKHYLEKVSATRFQNVGKPYETNGNAGSHKAQTRCGNPYKTCWILRLMEPGIENGLRNDQKALPREGFRNTIPKRRNAL